MMARLSFCLLLVLNVGAYTSSVAAVCDSLRMETRAGQRLLVYKVNSKETLHSIARKYKVPFRELSAANEGMKGKLQLGQILYVPYKSPMTAETKKAGKQPVVQRATGFTVDNNGVKWHILAPGQTLYSVAAMYQLSVAELQQLNKLSSTQVQAGQKLKVGKELARATTVTSKPEKPNEAETNAHTETPKVIAKTANESVHINLERVENIRPETSGKQIIESGLAAVITDRFQSNKFLALHRSAPIGTMLQVKNSMNGKSVYVRVIGRLPEVGENQKVVVKISRKAYKALNALDARFYSEVTYIQ